MNTHTAPSELGGEAIVSARGLAGFRFCLFAHYCAARTAETMLILPAQHVGLSTRSSTSLQKCLIIVCGPECADSWHNEVSGDWDTTQPDFLSCSQPGKLGSSFHGEKHIQTLFLEEPHRKRHLTKPGSLSHWGQERTG